MIGGLTVARGKATNNSINAACKQRLRQRQQNTKKTTKTLRRTRTKEESVPDHDPRHEVRGVGELVLGAAVPNGVDGLRTYVRTYTQTQTQVDRTTGVGDVIFSFKKQESKRNEGAD